MLRNKTIETIILAALDDYGMDEPAEVLAAEVYCRKCDATEERVNGSIRYLIDCGCIIRNETVCHDVTYSITDRGRAALKGC